MSVVALVGGVIPRAAALSNTRRSALVNSISKLPCLSQTADFAACHWLWCFWHLCQFRGALQTNVIFCTLSVYRWILDTADLDINATPLDVFTALFTRLHAQGATSHVTKPCNHAACNRRFSTNRAANLGCAYLLFRGNTHWKPRIRNPGFSAHQTAYQRTSALGSN